MDEYDVGLLNDWGGGNVAWWHDYLRYEIGRANSHWIQQTESLRAELAEYRQKNALLREALDDAAERMDRARGIKTSHNLCLSCGHSIDAHDKQYGCAEDGCDCETPNA